ncbi:alginate lyase, partial [Streptomyces sp. MBT33]|nr:alginate lyase [Streptomyces sp. MBT33]
MSGRSRAAVLLATVATIAAALVPSAHASPEAPATVVLDGARLQRTKALLDRGDPRLRRELAALTSRADDWLHQGPWTVVDKPRPAPGGAGDRRGR